MKVIASAILCGVLYYLFTPQLSLDSPFFLLLVSVPIVALSFATGVRFKRERRASPELAILPGLVVIGAFVVGIVSSMPIVRADAYRALLGEEKQADFKSSLPPIDLTSAPLVSHDMALRAAEKKLADIPALGSQTRVGELQKQLVNGKLYWVAFLEHRKFFAWFNKGATPGYVRVSATDPSDVQLITELGGRKLALRYLNSAYFGDDLYRHLRFDGYATAGLTDFSPEIDDSGRPYQVVTVFKRRVGFGGLDAAGVVLLDVQTGDSKFYATADVPKWVDRVQPEHLVRKQLQDRLEYVHGWLNPSNADKLAISGELDVIYAHDGRSYFFAGLGSTAKEGGLVGFMLVDTRSKEVTRYNLVGVTEDVAQLAAQGVFPEKRYSATNALPFMVEGVPTYVMALRDATGIARAYAMVDIADFQKVAVADTLAATARQFQAKQNLDRTAVDSAPRPDELRLEAKVLRIGMDVRNGTSSFVLVLEGQGSRLFTADTNRSDDLPVTQGGDTVHIRTVVSEKSRLAPVLEFKNLTLATSAPSASASAPH